VRAMRFSLFLNGLLLSIVCAEEQTCSADGTCTVSEMPNRPGYVEVAWGEDQHAIGEEGEATRRVIETTNRYMTEQVSVGENFALVRKECKLRHELCSFWAAIGECESNPAFMLLKCAPACQSCDQLNFETRCPFDKEPTAWKEGDLNKMFAHILKEYPNNEVLSKDPWVVTIDDFLSDEECTRLIELGGELGYERSEDVGTANFDGTISSVESKDRTSTNAWCTGACFEDPLSEQVHQKIDDLTLLPGENGEYLQLLQYEVGQFYGQHHDYIEIDIDRPQGVRILTVFLYLNDVEAGGGTNFPLLNITVMPKKGRVVVWPSVLDHRPNMKDSRTDHQALPVEKGIKYGANAWIHQRDFKDPHKRGCV
jgi:prolyl 4-hydroxylase